MDKRKSPKIIHLLIFIFYTFLLVNFYEVNMSIFIIFIKYTLKYFILLHP